MRDENGTSCVGHDEESWNGYKNFLDRIVRRVMKVEGKTDLAVPVGHTKKFSTSFAVLLHLAKLWKSMSLDSPRQKWPGSTFKNFIGSIERTVVNLLQKTDPTVPVVSLKQFYTALSNCLTNGSRRLSTVKTT